jgi:hypothetical protein
MIELLLGIVASLSGSVSAPGAVSAPPIKCEITLSVWCITLFNGQVELKDNETSRVWSIHNEDMRDGPLVIIEHRRCIGQSSANPVLVYHRVLKTEGAQINTIKYSLTGDGCSLEFQWPVGPIVEPSYKQMVLYGILVEASNSAKTQLFSISSTLGNSGDTLPN